MEELLNKGDTQEITINIASDLKTDNFLPKEAQSARPLLKGEMCRSFMDFVLEERKISSVSCGGIKLICNITFKTSYGAVLNKKMYIMLLEAKFHS